MASTVLPNGIIIPEKFSRDWYADLYHNWQELDNLLGGGTPKDGTLTIQKNGSTVGTFSANQATDETVNITVPDVNDGTLTIQQNGTTVDTFTANSSTDKTVNITVPTKTSDLTNDSDFVQSSDLATVATSGNYNDLSNKPTIPTVNNATLTIQKNGTTVDTFTANSSSDKTVNIEVPTKTSDLTNDSGFITGVSWNDVADKPSFATVATSGSYTDLSDKPTIPTVNDATLTIQKNGTTIDTFTANSSTNKTVNISVPTNTSELTNGAGFITADYAIPRSGGAVMTATSLGKTDNTSRIVFCGGTDTTKGGSITIYGKDSSSTGDITIQCTADSTNYYSLRLHSNGTFEHNYASIVKIDNSSGTNICGGKNSSSGAVIQVNGKDTESSKGFVFITANDGTRSNGIQIRPNGDTLLVGSLAFYPNTDNTVSLGYSAYRWTTVYAATGTINTSDSRLKNSIKDIDDKLLDAWEKVEPKQYKFNDATEKKGEKARYHTGYLAQDIQAECEKQGVNASEYGLFCYDEWEEQEEVSEEIETEKDGEIVKEKRIVQPRHEKGNSYALRYEEALVVECKYLRRCVERLTARIEELEKGNITK